MNTHNLMAVLAEVRKYDPDFSVPELLAFLMVASRPGQITQSEIRKGLGVSQSSSSRYIQALGKYNRHKRPGHDWVRADSDVADFRVKWLSLTPKGERVYQDLKQLMGDA